MRARNGSSDSQLNVGFIWHCTYPWDVRMEKLVSACTEAGHKVCLVTKGRHDLPPAEEDGSVLNVRVTPSTTSRKAAKILAYPLFFNPLWRSTVIDTFRQQKVDIIVVRDLPLAGLAISVGRELNTPVVLDMAENYPAALIAYENPMYRPFLFGNGWLPRKYEELSVRRLDKVLVVAEEQVERLARKCADRNKITLVGNTPVEEFLEASSIEAARSVANSNGRHLLYVGKLDVHRGVDITIEAMPQLRSKFPDIRLTLVGDGKQRERLQELAVERGVSDIVSFPGWVQWNGISEYIRQSTVCLIPHRRSEHTDTTLPNKLFDYMAFSKPVIASDCAPLRRIIEKHDCGAVFRSGDRSSYEATVSALLSDPQLANKGHNGREAVMREYRWELDKQRFLDVLHHLTGFAQQRASAAEQVSA